MGNVLVRTVSVNTPEDGRVTYLGGTDAADIPQEHRDLITNPKAWLHGDSEPTDEVAEILAGFPPGTTVEEILRARKSNDERDEEDFEVSDDLDSMTVPQLREHASDNEINLGGATTKADILKAIRDAEGDAGDS